MRTKTQSLRILLALLLGAFLLSAGMTADAVLFARYEKADTQHKMPAGVAPNLAADRTETTFGINFYPTSNLVFKADYQIRKDAGATDPANLFNLGAGWMF